MTQPPLPVADLDRLRANLDAVRERMRAACRDAGRDPDAVELVAVTKYAGVAYAHALLLLGQRDLGENRVQHLLDLDAGLKAAGAPAPRWHMIGHLQRNKARKVAGLLHALHSLDSLELAERLSASRPAGLPPLRVYIQLALAGEVDGRSGLPPEDLERFVKGLSGLTRLEIAGLMGLPPQGTPEEARAHFIRLRRALRGAAELSGVDGLSMGMTSDLEVAIQEGATAVRVGRALLEGLSDAAFDAVLGD